MNLNLLLEMGTVAHPDRVALGARADGITYRRLSRTASSGAARLRETAASTVVFLGRNGPVLPQVLFAASAAGLPFAPLNYRLPVDRLAAMVDRFDRPVLVVDPDYAWMLDGSGAPRITTDELTASGGSTVESPVDGTGDTGAPAVLLFTSGTTAQPKIVSLSHDNLTSYILESVVFGSAGEGECFLTSTPPYHIAAIASVLSNLYAGRRVVYLPDFEAGEWLATVRREGVTSAMVVPTMLSRIVRRLDGVSADTPTLTSVSYGGSRTAPDVIEAALNAFPAVDFVNAYGLTETSSTVALLGPDDHREAMASGDPSARARLSSAGRPLPGVEVEIRDDLGRRVAPGVSGELWIRGPQVSGVYVGMESSLDEAGWFATRDRAHLDAGGYLFVEGRLDDTIIRGGENIAPSEIEDVLRRHDAVEDVAVVGLDDEQWGQKIVAAVVPRRGRDHEVPGLQAWARERLRGSRTPDHVTAVEELPYSPLGKLVRRELVEILTTRMELTKGSRWS